MRLYCFVDAATMVILTWAHGSEGAHSISWGDLHVMNRGDRREAIFDDDEDRERLLQTLREACQKTGWQAQADRLMRNHFHLVVETPQPNLVAGMKWLVGAYRLNLGTRGHSAWLLQRRGPSRLPAPADQCVPGT